MSKHQRRRERDEHTADLFDHAEVFPVETPRDLQTALDYNTRIAHAMARALQEVAEYGVTRKEICDRITAMLGLTKPLTVDMLNGYTAQSRETHTISLVRFKAFVRATGCLWLWKEALDGDGLTLLQGEEAVHAQISLMETRARALMEEVKALKQTAPLQVGRGARR